MNITDFALRHRLTVFVLMFVLVVLGSYAYISLPRESFPDVTIPYIIVTTTYSGVSPADIESLLTKKIEKELQGLDDVKEILSTSYEGASVITIEFMVGTDINDALQKVKDKVDLAKPELPEDADEPMVKEINVADFPIMIIAFSGDYSLVKLKDIAEDMEEEIEAIAGVLDVDVVGGLDREVKVDIDPVRMRKYDISYDDIIGTIASENVTIPGGSVDIGNLKYTVRIPGEFENTMLIKDLVVKVSNGKPVYIRDIADVEFGFVERSSYARLNGRETVTLNVQKRSGENIVRIADDIRKLLEDKKPSFPGTTKYAILADQSKDIRTMVAELENNIITGFILVVLTLMIFLGFRNSIFVAVSIPFSMLIAFMVITAIGLTLNMVVLFSLILALGMIVDNAIVVVENIFRHRQEGENREEAASNGTKEVAGPVIASTVTTLCAFIPLLFWPGIMGDFMGFLPKTVIIILSASLFVALVFSPILSSVFMRLKKKDYITEDRREARILAFYRNFLSYALGHQKKIFFSAFSLLVVVIILYGFIGKGAQFMPQIAPKKIFVDVEAPSGTRLDTSDVIIRQIEEKTKVQPDLKDYVANVGSKGSGDISFGAGGGASNSSRVTLEFLDYHERTTNTWETLSNLRKEVELISGADIEVTEQKEGPPTGAPVNIEITGHDFPVLGEIAKGVREKIKNIPGITNLRDDFDEGRPEIRITVDREKAALADLSTSEIANTVRTAVYGTEASEFRDGEDEYDIRVRSLESRRNTLADISNIAIFKEGKNIPLSSLADIETACGLGSIKRKDRKRMVTVMADNAPGYLADPLLKSVQKELEGYKLPSGYAIAYTGESEDRQEASDFLSKAFVVVLFLIALVLIFQFDSLVLPLTIIFSVFLSLIGVLIGLIVTATPFGIIMTGLGVISLAGVVVNNAIVLIDYIQQLRQKGMEKTAAIIQAGVIRFRPVMLTAVTTILGLIPLSTGLNFDFANFKFLIGGESSEWWGAMGVAVIFGLAFATVLTLVMVPVMYSMLDSVEAAAGRYFSRE